MDLKKEKYEAVDGLRAFFAITILLMHVWANGMITYDNIIWRGNNSIFCYM